MRGGGMPPGAGAGPGGAERMNPAAMQAMGRIAMTVPTRLDIRLADSAVTIAYATDAEPFVLPFGKEVERELMGDLKLKSKARWDAGWVVITRSLDGGPSVKESLMASADGNRLTVDVEVGRGGGDPINFRRVNDRRKAASP